MGVSISTGGVVAFDRFWQWMKMHANCIVRAGSAEALLNDHEMFHWQLVEDDERRPLVQLMMGKQLIGELMLDLREVLYVQSNPDPEDRQGAQVVFEVMAGGGALAQETYPLYHFVLAHGLDDDVDTGLAEAQ
ncbi:MAG: hypothetical protein HY904_14210 [Deltaproteobacteria bacterium]|nr:hypothetical protein [Deltaproteobacteria bacterium]